MGSPEKVTGAPRARTPGTAQRRANALGESVQPPLYLAHTRMEQSVSARGEADLEAESFGIRPRFALGNTTGCLDG